VRKLLFLAIAICPLLVKAQQKPMTEKQQKKAEKKARIDKLIKQEEEGAIIFDKQGAFGIKLNTDGYGIFYEHGKYKSITTTNLWWAELGEHKHRKEERTTPESGGIIVGNQYIYGKINNFYNFKLGIGQQRLIGGKGNRNGVATTLIYGGGLALALLKPYYLQVKDPLTNEIKDIKFEQDSALFLNPNYILGASGFGKGFGEIKVKPGAQARVAFRFDYGRYNEILSAIEVGVNAEYYFQKIQHMAFNKDKNFIFNAYVALVFGKRK